MMDGYHVPVLLKASVDLLVHDPEGVYVDVTYGGGGHTGEILKRLTTGKVVAFDRDPRAGENLIPDERLTLVSRDFKFIEEALQEVGLHEVDGILADLGISSHQIDTPERGFSHRFEGPLDMRMDSRQAWTAADLLNEAPEEELAFIFRAYGEIRNARKLARVICASRKEAPLKRTSQFMATISSCMPPQRQAKYLSQVFQALRIKVNGELDALAALLEASLRLLRPGGRLAVISYHSLEDRMVKHFMRSGNLEDRLHKDFFGNPLTPWRLITRRPVQATAEEIAENPRARSARLRVAERKADQQNA